MRKRQLLIAVGASMLLLANIAATKIIPIPLPLIGTVEASAGVVPIAVVFFTTDVLSESYSRETARHAVHTMLVTLVVGWCVLQAVVVAPWAGGVPQQSVAAVLGASTPLVIASIVTATISQLFDVSLFHKLNQLTDGRHKWFRNIGSTCVSQFLDTALFTVLAFVVVPSIIGGLVLPFGVVGSIIAVEYVVRVSLSIVDTPLFYLITNDK